MALEEIFQKAQQDVTKLPVKPNNEELLNLYSIYKQATVGDVSGKKPGRLDMIARAKYEAWEKRRGMSKEEAMQKYVDYVGEMGAKYAGK